MSKSKTTGGSFEEQHLNHSVNHDSLLTQALPGNNQNSRKDGDSPNGERKQDKSLSIPSSSYFTGKGGTPISSTPSSIPTSPSTSPTPIPGSSTIVVPELRMMSSSPTEAGSDVEGASGGMADKKKSRTKDNMLKAKNFAKRILPGSRERSSSRNKSYGSSVLEANLPSSDDSRESELGDEQNADGQQIEDDIPNDGEPTSIPVPTPTLEMRKREKVKAFAKKILGGSHTSASSTTSSSLPVLQPPTLSVSNPNAAKLPVVTEETSPTAPLSHPPSPSVSSVASTGAPTLGGILEVTIRAARNLHFTDDGLVDAYCEVVLLDFFGNATKKDERKTKVIKGSSDPVWDETFVFDFDSGECSGVKIVCKDNHRFRDTFLGYVTISTSGAVSTPGGGQNSEKGPAASVVVDRWLPLCARKKDKRTCITGDIHVKISCISESEAEKKKTMKIYNVGLGAGGGNGGAGLGVGGAGPGALGQSTGPVGAAPLGKQKVREKLRKHFGASDDEILYDEFSCAFKGKQGRMFVTSQHLYFYSNIIVLTKIRIGYEDIKSVEKKKTAVLFPNAILITVKNARFFFYSFIHRDRAYQLIRMKKCSYMRKNQPDLDPSSDPEEEMEEVVQPDVLEDDDHHDEYLSITPKTARSDGKAESEVKNPLSSPLAEVASALPALVRMGDTHSISPIVPGPIETSHEAKQSPPQNQKRGFNISPLSSSAAPALSQPCIPPLPIPPLDTFDFLGSLSPRPTLSLSKTPPTKPISISGVIEDKTKTSLKSTIESVSPAEQTPLVSSSQEAPEIENTTTPESSWAAKGGSRPTALPRHLMGPHVLETNKTETTSTETQPGAKKEELGHRGKCVGTILVTIFLGGFILPGVGGGWQALCAFSIIFSTLVSLLQETVFQQAQQLGLILVSGRGTGSEDGLRMETLAKTWFPLLLQPVFYFFFTMTGWLLIDDFLLRGFFGWVFFPFVTSLVGLFIHRPDVYDQLFGNQGISTTSFKQA